MNTSEDFDLSEKWEDEDEREDAFLYDTPIGMGSVEDLSASEFGDSIFEGDLMDAASHSLNWFG